MWAPAMVLSFGDLETAGCHGGTWKIAQNWEFLCWQFCSLPALLVRKIIIRPGAQFSTMTATSVAVTPMNSNASRL